MPTFEVTAPDGRRFRVTAPEGASQDDVLAYVQQQTQNQQPAPEQAVSDPAGGASVVGNVAGAAARGLSNFIGLPADAAELAGRGASFLGRMLPSHPGVTPEMLAQTGSMYDASRFATPPAAPTSTAVRGVMRDAGVPVDARAASPAGRIVQDAIEGAASLPVGGPAMLYGALSGAGAGGAGEAVRGMGGGEDAETAARVAGGFAAPLAAGRVAAGRASAATRPPTSEQLKGASDDAYKAASAAGVRVRSPDIAMAVDDIARTAVAEGLDPTLHPKATRVVERLREAAANGTDLSLDEIDTLRKVARTAAGSLEPDERRIGRIIIDKIDDFVLGLDSSKVSTGNVNDGVAALTQARELWSRGAKGETIDNLIERANIRASQFSGSGLENALRTEFRGLAMNPKQMRKFTADEQAAIKKVAEGGPVENFFRFVGKLAPTGVVSAGMGGGIGYAAGGLPGAAAAAGTGAASRGIATMMTERNAQRASETMRAGRPVVGVPVDGQALAAALLAAEREASRPDPRLLSNALRATQPR
jgi:hypothetical protein